MKLKVNKIESYFKPVVVTLTIESQSELDTIVSICNLGSEKLDEVICKNFANVGSYNKDFLLEFQKSIMSNI